jgi:hypothetical protein
LIFGHTKFDSNKGEIIYGWSGLDAIFTEKDFGFTRNKEWKSKLDGIDGPYIFDNIMFTVNSENRIDQNKMDRNKPIKAIVNKKDRDEFDLALKNLHQQEIDNYDLPSKLISKSAIEGNFNDSQSSQIKVWYSERPEVFFRAENTWTGQNIDLQLEKSLPDEIVTWQGEDQIKEGAAVTFNLDHAQDSLHFQLIRQRMDCTGSVSFIKDRAELGLATLPIPNVLSPNSDGQDDAWCFGNWADFESCFSIKIANRWGYPVLLATILI